MWDFVSDTALRSPVMVELWSTETVFLKADFERMPLVSDTGQIKASVLLWTSLQGLCLSGTTWQLVHKFFIPSHSDTCSWILKTRCAEVINWRYYPESYSAVFLLWCMQYECSNGVDANSVVFCIGVITLWSCPSLIHHLVSGLIPMRWSWMRWVVPGSLFLTGLCSTWEALTLVHQF